MSEITMDECSLDCLYIHDMTSTVVSNDELRRYISKYNIDMSQISDHIRNHMVQRPSAKTEVVLIQCYECDRVGNVQQDKKHLITIVGEEYTHYVPDPVNGTHVRYLACEDSFNVRTGKFSDQLFRQERFFSEQESSSRVCELVTKRLPVYGNRHRFINEFCYNLYEGFDGVNFKGKLLEKPAGFRKPLFMKSPFFKSETVIFGNAKSLEVVDDSHIKEYSYNHKTLAFDIETIVVDESGCEIDDQIIQISLVYQEGTVIYRVIGITQREARTDSAFYDYSCFAKHCSNTNLPDVEIYCLKSEKQLIEKFIELFTDLRPDYLTGYNILGFDIQLLLKSADRHNIDLYERLAGLTAFRRNAYSITQALKASKKRKSEDDISTLEDNNLFDLNYDLLPGLLVNDLKRCHKGESLDELARSSLGFGKVDMNYSDIPRLFYSEKVLDRSELLKYNVWDSLLCTALLNSTDNFCSYKFFVTSSESSKIPHSQFFNGQKTPMISPMFFYAFSSKNMLQEAKIKPATEHNRLCVTQILQYLLYDIGPVTIPEARELIEKFQSGEIKTKTMNKHFDLNSSFSQLLHVDFNCALQILDKQFSNAKKNNKKHGNFCYTLTHLMLFIRFLTEPINLEYDLKGLIVSHIRANKLGRYAPVNVSKGKKIKKLDTNLLLSRENELIEQLELFVRYLARRSIYSSHTICHLLNDYFENELIKTNFQSEIERFALRLNDNDSGLLTKNFNEFLHLYKNSESGQRFKDAFNTYNTFCEAVWDRIGKHLLMKFDKASTFDGAYVFLPNPGAEVENPVMVADFSAMYPSIGIGANMGPETIVSRRTILENNLKENEDYVIINISNRDDYRKVDLRSLGQKEVGRNFVCFLTTKHVKSTYCKVWEGVLNCRLQFKHKIGTFDDPRDNKLVEEKSNTYKVIANSFYGILSHMAQWKISACITSKGRQHIKNVARYIQNKYDGEVVYGDSVMPYTPITIMDENKKVKVTTFESLAEQLEWKPYREFKSENEAIMWDKEQAVPKQPIMAMTSSGWKPIRRIVRHKTAKQIHRIVTHTGLVDVTEDHSLINDKKNLITPKDATVGTNLLQIPHDESYVIDPTDTDISTDLAYVFGVFVGDGHCGTYNTRFGLKHSWKISNQNMDLLKRCLDILEAELKLNFTIQDTMASSNVYNLVPNGNRYGDVQRLAAQFRTNCYLQQSKIVPEAILRSGSQDILKAFHRGLFDSDGNRKEYRKQGSYRIDTKNQLSAHTYVIFLKRLGMNVSVNDIRDKPQIYRLTYSQQPQRKLSNKIKKNFVLHENYTGLVYDIETEDGTFNGGIGDIVLKNTDSVMYHLNHNTNQLCALYKSGELLGRGWLHEDDRSLIDIYGDDPYKQACEISAAISKRLTNELNNVYLTQPEKAIYAPPSKLEHEKVMLPFVIFGRKHYFAKIMDSKKDDDYIIRGLEARRRNSLLATEALENEMFRGMLQRNPSSWKTFQLARKMISDLMAGTIDLKLISSRQKITVTSNRLNGKSADAGVDLFKRMKQRGEIVDTGGFDKISIQVIKVNNPKNKNATVKYESLDYLTKLRRENQPLNLNNKGIARQILSEVVSIMSVVHCQKTFSYFENLMSLKISDQARPEEFERFVRPVTISKDRRDTKNTRVTGKSLLNHTLHNYYQFGDHSHGTQKQSIATHRKRKPDESDELSSKKKQKQCTLSDVWAHVLPN